MISITDSFKLGSQKGTYDVSPISIGLSYILSVNWVTH